jgi:HD-GYP domain-containing protein (c-di-GMP phosphodiesterase class II)
LTEARAYRKAYSSDFAVAILQEDIECFFDGRGMLLMDRLKEIRGLN